MKTSKIYLALCGLVLVVSGAFASKVANKVAPTTIWYKNTAGSCVSTFLEIEPCAHVGAIDCLIATPGGNKTAYQSSNCIASYKRFARII